MRFQPRHNLAGTRERRFQRGISKISGLEEIPETSETRIWIRGQALTVREFSERVYGAADNEQALEALSENEQALGIGLYSEDAGEIEEKGDVGGNAGEIEEKGGESI
jgi:hypothetical protein